MTWVDILGHLEVVRGQGEGRGTVIFIQQGYCHLKSERGKNIYLLRSKEKQRRELPEHIIIMGNDDDGFIINYLRSWRGV